MSNKNSDYYFLKGGGEMGELIRAKDWSKTSIGQPEEWPQSLRITLSILLNSKFPMFLLWSDDLICFYNDAYRPSLGNQGKHPAILGMPGKEAWPETWDSMQPIIEKVMKDGESTWCEDRLVPIYRNGSMEDAYWTFSHSPVHLDTGEVAGSLVTCVETTKNVLALRNIEESKRLYETIAQNTPDLIYVFDLNYRFAYANEALLKMWGRTWDDAIGKGMLELGYEPWHAEMHEREIDQVIATKKPVRGEVSFPHAKLGLRMYDYIFAPVINGKGEVEAIAGTTRDISDIKNAEEELKKSEEQFSTLADNMENLAWLADGEGWIYWYNKRWLDYTGLSLEEMQGWGWQKVQHPDHVERVVELFKKIWYTNETFELTFPLRRHDGEYRWFLTRGYPVTNEEGKIIQWIGTSTDIDEQKKAEDQFRLLADQAPMWVWLTDKEINVLYANPEVLRFIGIAHYTEFTGHTWEQKVHSEDIALVYKSFGEAVSLQQSFSFEFRVQNALTQQYEWFYIKGVPRWEGGEFKGFIGTGININEQKLILTQLEYRTVLLEAHNEASHDGILLVDTKGTILSYNRRFIEIWNMPQQIVLDKDDEKALAFALPQLVDPDKFIEKVKWLYENPDETSIDEVEFKDGRVIKRYGYHVAGTDGKYYGCSWIFRDITEPIKSERMLKESEERFRSLVQTLPQLIWITDAEGNQEFASSRWKEYTGFEPNGEKEWREIVHPEDYDNINAAWIRSLKTESIYTFNVRLKSKLGEYRWHVVKGEPVLDAANKIVKWVGSFTDIHEHKKAEEQFRQMAERMPQKVWTADALGNRNYVNQIMLDYTGLTFEELKDWGWKKIIHPEDWPRTKQKWEYSINTGEDFENETRLLRNDGKYLWHLVRATAIKEKGIPKIWIGSKTEIQEQIQLSETLGENLKLSNERMQTILQHAPDAVISIDEDGIIMSWNYEAELIFGWKEHEVIEKTLTETIIPKRYREGHDMGIKHFLRTGEGPVINKPIELSALKKNGSEFPVELKISTSKINDSYIFIGFIRDISIRKAAEETIQNKTNQLIEAQQLAHIGSWEWDVPTNKINWSDELYRIYGLTPQEFEVDYEHFIQYVYPDDREYVNAIVQQAFKDHQPYQFFHRIASADGNVRILSATGKVITDGFGNVIRMSGTGQDVTEQKKYEEELKIGEERFFKIFDSNPIPMTLSEIKTNKIKYANNLFCNAFGYTKEEVIGNSSEELNLIDPEEYKRVIDLIFGYLHENRSLEEVKALSKEETETLLLRLRQTEKMKDFEILYTRKNGETFPALVSFQVIRIGTESYTVTSYQDITIRKKSETLLREQNDQLEKMNKELESFAYISSHDLQEPLRKIQTFAERIMEKEENNLSEYGKDMFNRMQNAAKRMQTLIQDLLAYSRTSITECRFVTTDLNEIIAEIKEDLKEEVKEKHANIEADQLCDAEIIPFQFRQLMHNLIGNSLKFSNPENPPHIQIKSEIATGIKFNNEKLSPQNKYCRITVSDNGIGFEQQYSEKIFEVFQRLHGINKYNGTGIGLSIVKKIVENHHGIITAKGELNKGATFEIYIPAK